LNAAADSRASGAQGIRPWFDATHRRGEFGLHSKGFDDDGESFCLQLAMIAKRRTLDVTTPERISTSRSARGLVWTACATSCFAAQAAARPPD
jgi:hypothetical protein